jgi:hypothetical protein
VLDQFGIGSPLARRWDGQMRVPVARLESKA